MSLYCAYAATGAKVFHRESDEKSRHLESSTSRHVWNLMFRNNLSHTACPAEVSASKVLSSAVRQWDLQTQRDADLACSLMHARGFHVRRVNYSTGCVATDSSDQLESPAACLLLLSLYCQYSYYHYDSSDTHFRAAATRGLCKKSLRKRLDSKRDEAADLGPVDFTCGSHQSWRRRVPMLILIRRLKPRALQHATAEHMCTTILERCYVYS